MVEKTEVYVDTSAFIAFLDRSDTHHARFRRLFSEPPGIFTTTLVIAEGHAWFLRRYDRFRALQFLAMIEDLEPLKVVQVGSGRAGRRDTAATQVLRSRPHAHRRRRPPRDAGAQSPNVLVNGLPPRADGCKARRQRTLTADIHWPSGTLSRTAGSPRGRSGGPLPGRRLRAGW